MVQPTALSFFLGWEGLSSTEEVIDEAYKISHGSEMSGFGAYVGKIGLNPACDLFFPQIIYLLPQKCCRKIKIF